MFYEVKAVLQFDFRIVLNEKPQKMVTSGEKVIH